jgi:5'-nucleotidase / UDP-sugar diphosphatase
MVLSMRSRGARRLAVGLFAPLCLSACKGDGGEATFTLQLLHASDQEGNVGAIEDAPRFSAVLEALRARLPRDTVTVTSGDVWIPGPFHAAGADVETVALDDGRTLVLGGVAGRPDVAMLSAMGFQAASFGNHEWDRGPAEVAAILGRDDVDGDGDDDWRGASFPYLSANLDVSDSELAELVRDDGLPWTEAAGGVARSTVVTVSGERIGIVGVTTPTLEDISSPGRVVVRPASDSIDELAEIIQASVDALRAEGIDKIVLLAHMQQIVLEIELAERLHGVDVIVAGGSNTRLADATDRLRPGDEAQGPYPMMLANADGDPLALVSTDGSYRYVGRLVLRFDEAGVIVPSSIHEAVNGAYATDEAGVAAVGGRPNRTVAAIARAVGGVVLEKDGNTFGATDVWLEGRRELVRTEETNLGNLTADANLAYARLVDPTVEVSIKNGGGIRREIGVLSVPAGSLEPPQRLPPQANPVAGKREGEVSQLDIEATLAFNNGLSLLTLRSDELLVVLEHAVSGWEPGATPGAFPQIGGMRMSFDPERTAQVIDPETGLVTTPGERVRSVALVDDAGACVRVLVIEGVPVPGQELRIVTLGFLADGGDGYPLRMLAAPMRIDLDDEGAVDVAAFPWTRADFAPLGTEQDALAELLAATTSVEEPFAREETPPEDDARIQNLAVRSGTVIVGCT